jgi:hypothetical protein
MEVDKDRQLGSLRRETKIGDILPWEHEAGSSLLALGKMDQDATQESNHDNGCPSLPSMTRRTHDHARPPRPTTSTTSTRHDYIVNTTSRAFLGILGRYQSGMGKIKGTAREKSSGSRIYNVIVSRCSSRPFYFAHARLVSPQNTPLIESLGPIRASITRILVLHYRMYPYTVRKPYHEPICMTSSAT